MASGHVFLSMDLWDVLVTASCSRLEDAAVQNFQSPLIDLLRPGAGKGTNPESRPEDVGNPRKFAHLSNHGFFSTFEFVGGGEKFH